MKMPKIIRKNIFADYLIKLNLNCVNKLSQNTKRMTKMQPKYEKTSKNGQNSPKNQFFCK